MIEVVFQKDYSSYSVQNEVGNGELGWGRNKIRVKKTR